MINGGATHVGVATDHVIESFRNRLWPGYKTGAGIDPDLLAQFPLLEEALGALGISTWPMIEFEADDALAAAAAAAARDPRVERVIICTPDKDLAQCVRGTRVVQMDRRTRTIRDEAGIVAKFGVPPVSIPDYLALVGDSADGYPGLPGWGAKSTAAVLAKFGHLESIPADWRTWGVNAASPGALASTLERERERAFLFRDLATLRCDIPLFENGRRSALEGADAGVRSARRSIRRGRGRVNAIRADRERRRAGRPLSGAGAERLAADSARSGSQPRLPTTIRARLRRRSASRADGEGRSNTASPAPTE